MPMRSGFFVAACLLVLGVSPASAQTRDDIPDELIVRYEKSPHRSAARPSAQRWLDAQTAVIRMEKSGARRTWREFNAVLAEWRGRPGVVFAEPNHRGYFAEVDPVEPPNDPRWDEQWWLSDVGARSLWAVSRGDGVTVAVIDSGVDLSHPDLTGALLSEGYDFGDMTAFPQDRIGHGTSVAGVIAARQGNSLGVSGLAPGARILPIKISPGGEGSFLSDRLASAINYATDAGASVINLSLTAEPTQIVRESVLRAISRGVVVIAAAGNTGGSVAFPASIEGVVAVGSAGRNGQFLSASATGASLSIAAPGEGILSTDLGGGYVSRTGTSLAAPIVSAATAALWSFDRTATGLRVVDLLKRSTRRILGTENVGLLDAGAAIQFLLPRLAYSSAARGEGVGVSLQYVLPATANPVKVVIAVETPWGGNFSLASDGTWREVEHSGFVSVAVGYANAEEASGVLFGRSGVFPELFVDASAGGQYRWRVAYLNEMDRVVGTPYVLEMTLP